MNVAQETGALIRYYRKERQMTVEQLAAAICKSKSCVSKYETGRLPLTCPHCTILPLHWTCG